MKIRTDKVHKHHCYSCRSLVSCWVVHLKDKTDVSAMLCDNCCREALAEIEEDKIKYGRYYGEEI